LSIGNARIVEFKKCKENLWLDVANEAGQPAPACQLDPTTSRHQTRGFANGPPLHVFKCSCRHASRGFAHPRGLHSASFAKLGFAERGTDVDEGTRDEGTRVP
jgi:hypothetical protein